MAWYEHVLGGLAMLVFAGLIVSPFVWAKYYYIEILQMPQEPEVRACQRYNVTCGKRKCLTANRK